MDHGSLSARRPRPFSRGQRSRPSTSTNDSLIANNFNLDNQYSENAQSQYIQTYKQILHHADLLSGGRKELSAKSNSIFRDTREKLKSLGVITPRSNNNRSNSSRQQNKRFPQLPPLNICGPQQSMTLSNTIKSSESRDSDDNSDDEDAEEDTYNPESPRAIFLSGCVRYRIPPRSIAMLRKRLAPKLNLAHMSIGNQIAIILSEALEKMPYLQVLNISDNNLNDIGLSAIIHSAARHGTLEELDISLNVIDEQAADALATYIGNESCSLKCLKMSSAGIDDRECARFVEVLMHNRCLKELDMSKNLLGKDENLNVVKPDFITGGEILADLLRDSSCPLEKLNLHWNMIRLEGAEVLCDALRSNAYLTHLDLSYNALGTHAGCILGSALLENDTLRILNLSNNGIDCIGALTLSIGMRENTSLREVNMDGNPIGEQGARALMKVVAQEGHRLLISTLNCDIVTKSSSVKMKLDNPVGDYLLCMNHPYDRAIAYEVLDIVSNDANYEVGLCDIYLAGDGSTNTNSNKHGKVVGKEGGLIETLRFGVDDLGPLVSSFAVDCFDKERPSERVFDKEIEEKEFLDVLSAVGDISYNHIETVISRYDFTRTHVIDVSNLSSVIHELLMHDQIDEETSRYKQIHRKLSDAKDLTKEKIEKLTIDLQKYTEEQFPTFVSQPDDEQQDFLSLSITNQSEDFGNPSTLPPSTDSNSNSNDTILETNNNKMVISGEKTLEMVAMDRLLKDLADDCQRILDARATGVIDVNILTEYILQRARVAKLRCFELQHVQCCTVRPKAGASMVSNDQQIPISTVDKALSVSRPQTGLKKGPVRFHPPAHGWMHIRLIESFDFANKKSLSKLSLKNFPKNASEKSLNGAISNNVNDFFIDRPGGYTMSRARCMRLIEGMKKIAKAQPLTLLQYVLDNSWLRLEEAQLIYSFARHYADDPIAILTSILLRMINTFEAKRMVQFATSDDVLKLRRVKQRLGSAYNPLIGVYTGHYQLDLSNPVDRKCLKSLIEKSFLDMESRRKQGLHDTSQHGHWSCFRNEYYRPGVAGGKNVHNPVNFHSAMAMATSGSSAATIDTVIATTNTPGKNRVTTAATSSIPQVAESDSNNPSNNNHNSSDAGYIFKSDGTAPSIVIVPKLFCPIPSSGLLEFDFVNIHRPTILTCRPVQDNLIIDCLLLSRLLENDDVEWALRELQRMRQLNRTTMFPSGRPAYRVTTGRAERIAEQLTLLYGNLYQRQATRKVSLVKEGLSSVQTNKKNDDKKCNNNIFKSSGGQSTNCNNNGNKNGQGLRKFLAVVHTVQAQGEQHQAEDANDEIKAKHQKLRFRSFSKQGTRARHKLNMWEMRMIEIIYGLKGSDEYKASVLLEFFEVEMGTFWLECRHVVLLLDVFSPIGLIQRSNFGSYRVELFLFLFDRIIDLHNIELIWSVLTAEEQAAIVARIGCLNLFNPGKCEGGWSLSLSRWEEVQLIKMLVHLSVAEPGQNWLNQVFALYRGSAPVPSWELNRAWFSEEGMPRNGQISFEMYAGDGLRLNNCTVNPILRQMLTSLTLVSQRNYVAEADFFSIDPSLTTLTSVKTSPKPVTHGGILAEDGEDAILMDSNGNNSKPTAVFFNTEEMEEMDSTTSAFTIDKQGRLKESRLMEGLCHAQRLALYALCHGTGTFEELLQHQHRIADYESLLQREHETQPVVHGMRLSFSQDVLDDHYHAVAHFTLQDAQDHLERSTDIKWQYSTNRKPDIWV